MECEVVLDMEVEPQDGHGHIDLEDYLYECSRDRHIGEGAEVGP